MLFAKTYTQIIEEIISSEHEVKHLIVKCVAKYISKKKGNRGVLVVNLTSSVGIHGTKQWDV